MSDLQRTMLADALALLGLPAAGSALSLGRLVVEEHRRRASKALAAAEEITGLSREEIADKVQSDPETVPLLVRVLQAVGNSGNDQTLEMLGAALGRGIDDARQRPKEELLVVAVDGLTDEQLCVLAACTTEPASTEKMIERMSGRVAPALTRMALTMLHPRGLFVSPYGRYGGGEYWELSELGVAVRDAAAAAYPHRVDG